ncbi:sperm acrosome membrane-associated protein 6 isoform X1 [Hippocampus comes]|uniref:sperm acrosome membrane-associated protein 6 isoform X1 n=2 Tax=Hippocampus comes TaxID=109280 RepID=UPI00094E7966|nr:PREDICTED: sperm acrosome membrane-associated protein 6 isoform X1 [Hippocampus comes]
MCTFALCFLLLCVLCGLVRPSVGCFRCFVSLKETSELCSGYKMTTFHLINVDRCFETLDSIFNDNPKVIEAGRVGKAYEAQLQNIMKSQILPLVDEFRQTTNYDTVYESKLQTAADNFIAEASKLPRATGCIPPCGFQTADGHYDCVKCKKDSCNFPLDCPVENRTVEENNPVQMLCDVSFQLPQNTKIMKIWKFAEQVKTRQVELFEEVTVGEDNLYSISSTRTHHQGTYQCEIYSDEISIARIYYYLTVTPHVVTGHSELQEIFELSLLPGGRLHAESPRPSQYLPSRVLIAICFTSLLLLLILSLGTIFLENASGTERTRRNQDL